MNEFIEELTALCAKYRVALSGQLVFSPDEVYPQEIRHEQQAYWGPHKVRDKQALVFSRITPEPEIVTNCRTGSLHISSDIAGYNCPVTGKWVDGRRDHRENLKRTGCRVLEPGEKEQFMRDHPKEVERQAEKAADFLSDQIAKRWDAPA